MTNSVGRRLSAGALALLVSSTTAFQTGSDLGLTPTIVSAQSRDPLPQPRSIRAWKIDDVPRVQWTARTSAEAPKAPEKQQAKKKSNRGLAVALIAIGGAVAGGLVGSTVEGSLCECDDRRPVGAAYGALFGGAIAGIIAFSATR